MRGSFSHARRTRILLLAHIPCRSQALSQAGSIFEIVKKKYPHIRGIKKVTERTLGTVLCILFNSKKKKTSVLRVFIVKPIRLRAPLVFEKTFRVYSVEIYHFLRHRVFKKRICVSTVFVKKPRGRITQTTRTQCRTFRSWRSWTFVICVFIKITATYTCIFLHIFFFLRF